LVSGKPQPSVKDLNGVLEVVVQAKGGIVIAAHANDGKGVLDDKQMAACWHQDAIRNEHLLCIELPKPRDYYRQFKDRVGMIVRNDPGEWHRGHPVAIVNSSDCKRLHESDGTGDESWIGKRFTWIKMSEPSIEGLRQAFLDHESRIRFGDKRPEDLQTHPRIERIQVRGTKFLADQEILLSPNLTTFIGGGGTGKSTIIEYLRCALGQRSAAATDVLENTKKAIASLGTGQVDLTLRQAGGAIDVTYNDGKTAATVSGSEVADLPSRFPVLVLGQREIFAIASSGEETLRVLDQLQRDRIEECRRQSAALQDEIAGFDSELDTLPSLLTRRKSLAEERARKEGELSRLESHQEPLARRNLLLREQTTVTSVDTALERVVTEGMAFANELALGVKSSAYKDPDVPHVAGVAALVARAQGYVDQLGKKVQEAVEELRKQLKAEQEATERKEWREALVAAAAEYNNLLAEPGVEPVISADALRTDIQARRIEYEALDDQIGALEKKVATRPKRLAALRGVWASELSARQEMAKHTAELVPTTRDGSPFISVEIKPFADEETLLTALNAPLDHRSVAEDEVRKLCSTLRETGPGSNPLDVFITGLEQADADNPPSWFKTLRQPVRNELRSKFSMPKRQALQRVRIPDRAVVTLRRADGSVAGTLDSGLSVGQKCTAVLALVLSAGGHQPIIIDQPEDEIDNEFIYRELVPLLRGAKQQRQVILATHNPNLPVNGDAELIYPLQARAPRPGASARGAPWKTSDSTVAIGSLDQVAVKEAVEEIMEGSPEAFLRRQARYGF
jgi:Skp family chaperone for outer membrane proteins